MSVEDVLREHTAHDKDSFERLDQRLDRLEGLITVVAAAQQKQVGFFAGVSAAVSVIVAGILFTIQWLKN